MPLRVFILAIFGFIAGQVVQAAPCVPGTLNSYLGSSCTFANNVFTAKDFVFDSFNLNPPVPVELATASDFDITPPSELGSGFEFNSTKLNISGFQHVGYLIAYFIDPPPPVMPGFEDFLFSFSPVAPGTASITTELCVGGEFVGPFVIGTPSTCVSDAENAYQVLTVFDNGTATDKKLFDSVSFQPTNRIGVRNFIELAANGASSQIDGFGNTAIVTPEPGSMLFGAAGLAALLLLRRR